MTKEKNGLFARGLGGTQANHEVLLARIGTEKVHVFPRESGIEKALCHRLRARCHAALRGIGGVDLDKLLENIPGFGAVGAGGWYDSRLRDRCLYEGDKEAD